MSKNSAFFLFILSISVAVLATVYIMEYGFGLKPCPLCLWQRWPWWGALFVAFLGATILSKKTSFLLNTLLILFFISAGFGFYHGGVEYGFWESLCFNAAAPEDSQALLEWLETQQPIECKKPAFLFLGVSLAGWNMIASLLLFGILGYYRFTRVPHG